MNKKRSLACLCEEFVLRKAAFSQGQAAIATKIYFYYLGRRNTVSVCLPAINLLSVYLLVDRLYRSNGQGQKVKNISLPRFFSRQVIFPYISAWPEVYQFQMLFKCCTLLQQLCSRPLTSLLECMLLYIQYSSFLSLTICSLQNTIPK